VHEAVAITEQVNDIRYRRAGLLHRRPRLCKPCGNGVDAQNALLAQRRRQQQLAQLSAKTSPASASAFFFNSRPSSRLHAGAEDGFTVGILRGQLTCAEHALLSFTVRRSTSAMALASIG